MKLVPYQRNLFGSGLFNDFFSDEATFDAAPIKADVKETDEAYIVEAEIPGVKKEDVTLVCEKGILTITSSTSRENTQEKDGYIRKERFIGEAKRSFRLKDIEEESISAKLEEGILYVTLPKREIKKEERQIEIE